MTVGHLVETGASLKHNYVLQARESGLFVSKGVLLEMAHRQMSPWALAQALQVSIGKSGANSAADQVTNGAVASE